MKKLAALLLLLTAFAPLIAMADGTLCMTGSPAATATCSPGISYGVTLTTTAITFLNSRAGSGNCIKIQASPYNGSSDACIAEGVTASTVSPSNCFTLRPGQSYYVYNLNSSNYNGIVPNQYFSGLASAGTANLTYEYCQ